MSFPTAVPRGWFSRSNRDYLREVVMISGGRWYPNIGVGNEEVIKIMDQALRPTTLGEINSAVPTSGCLRPEGKGYQGGDDIGWAKAER